MTLWFYFSSSLAILATLLSILSKHAVHALLYFVLSILSLAMTLQELGASFAAVLEVMIYAGAIMVLFVLVVMLLNPNRELQHRNLLAPAFLAAALLFELLFKKVSVSPGPLHPMNHPPWLASIFRDYGTLVELSSFVLLAGLLVAFRVSRK
ncbi:MAG: NADH-quinone oxidoreductase subunit J [Myxococcaceae bacterium]|nr:NADH-quinone oxidoreductase subunit J [Myxococcaceae bacterium]MBH2006443.1 NADH-quinone oxidoreductase subunit J [Myxococcaceae bacterium]